MDHQKSWSLIKLDIRKRRRRERHTVYDMHSVRQWNIYNNV